MNDDNNILQILQTGSAIEKEQAFEIIYNKYNKLIFFIAIKITNEKHYAEEVVNDVFLNFYRNIANVKSGSLKYYLTTAAKNTSLNYVAKSAREIAVVNDDVIYTAKAAKQGIWKDYVDEFQNYLSEEELEIVIYHLIYNYSFKEIAAERNVSIFSISSKYRRSLQKIKKYYKEEKNEH